MHVQKMGANAYPAQGFAHCWRRIIEDRSVPNKRAVRKPLHHGLYLSAQCLLLLLQDLTNQSHSIERVALPYAIAGSPVNTKRLLIIVQRLFMLSLEHF